MTAPDIEIVEMRADDTEEASRVLRRSIAELCTADHGGEAATVARWTANKTPGRLSAWLERSSIHLLVARIDGRIAGLGGVVPAGEIVLNYVSPDFRFRGVSKRLLAAMEEWLAASGVERGTLTSTKTALQFYLDAGWVQAGPCAELFGVPGYPMIKRLA